MVGYKSCADLFVALCDLHIHLVDKSSPQPPHPLNRIEGCIRKTSRLYNEADKQTWVESVKKMLDQQLSGAHKFYTSQNHPPEVHHCICQ